MLEKRKLLFRVRKTCGVRHETVSEKELKFPDSGAIGKCMKTKMTAFRVFDPQDFIPGGFFFIICCSWGPLKKSRSPPQISFSNPGRRRRPENLNRCVLFFWESQTRN
jgi:hypothetical protein